MIADAGGQIPQAQVDALSKRLDGLVVPTGKLREVANNSFKAQGFGSFADDAKDIAKAKELDVLINNALVQVTNEDGTKEFQVRNPVSANISLIKLARLANGAGVLSDKDVSRVQGSERLMDIVDRLMEKRIGHLVELKKADISEGGLYYNRINPDTNKLYKIGEETIYGGASVSSDDLLAMRDLLGAQKEYFDSQMRDKLPNVIREIQANFSGLTLDDIHKGTGLGDYLDGGIHTMLESGQSLSQFEVRNVARLVDMGVDNLDQAIEEGKILPKPHEMNRLRNTFAHVNRQNKLNKEEGNAVNEIYSDQPKPLPAKQGLKPPPASPEQDENGRNARQVMAGFGTGASSMKGVDLINKKRLNDAVRDSQADPIKKYNSPQQMRKSILEGVKSPTQKKKLAEQFGVDEKLSNRKFKKAIEQQINAKIEAWAKKNGIKKLGKVAVGSMVTGGVALGVGMADTIWEAYTMWDTFTEDEKNAIKKSLVETGSSLLYNGIIAPQKFISDALTPNPNRYYFGKK
jgi:hypothetical protein